MVKGGYNMEEKNIYGEIVDKYLANYKLKLELDTGLYELKPREEWINTLQKRAEMLQTIFVENQSLIEKLQKLLAEELTEESAEKIYEQAYRLHSEEVFLDENILLPMIYKLIPYYEERNNIQRLLALYHNAYYIEDEIREKCKDEKYTKHLDYLHKVISYSHHYKELSDYNKRILGSSYNNLSIVALSGGLIDFETSYKYWKEAMAFWNSEEVQEDEVHIGQRQKVLNYLKRWVVMAEEYMETASQEIKEAFCKYAKQIYEEDISNKSNLLERNSEYYAAYLRTKVLMGEMTYDEIVDEYFDYYLKKIDSDFDVNNLSSEDLYFIINVPLVMEGWLKKGIDTDKCKKIMRTFHENLQKFWYMEMRNSTFINEFFSVWCSKIIKYLDTAEEKENCICQLILRRQLPTYLHSMMVMKLSEILCQEAICVKPSLFSDITDVSWKDMETFVKRCALLHDLGKTKITDVINTQDRKITDREFGAIKKHPSFGADILSMDYDLVKYHDVILGHHKSYDGTIGYPAEFDNTKSEYRIIIDMITICDCVDAATDYLGRNYKYAKKFDDVLEELIAGKGVRYNPDLVELIEQSEKVKRKMREIVEYDRLEMMYHAYVVGLN